MYNVHVEKFTLTANERSTSCVRDIDQKRSKNYNVVSAVGYSSC